MSSLHEIEISTDLPTPQVAFRWAWPVSVLYYRSSAPDELRYVLKVHGRLPHAGEPDVDGWFGTETRFADPIPVERFGEELRASLLQHLEHELDESLFVGGAHVRDPHPVVP